MLKYPIFILAGGLATRLRPKTLKIPKYILEVCGRPFVFHQIELLKKNGFQKFIISSGYLEKKIKYTIKNSDLNKNKIDIRKDGKKLLGTGGAVINSLKYLPNIFCLIFGDSYLPINYKKYIDRFDIKKYDCLITVYKNNNKYCLSNINIVGNKIKRYKKLKIKNKNYKYINYGFMIFKKDFFKNYLSQKGEKLDLDLMLEESIKNNKTQFLKVKKTFFEIGSNEGIARLENYLKQRT